MVERTSIGLDVHVRSVIGCAIDGDTGEVFRRRLTPDFGEILAWILSLPGPVGSVYEAGPTGFGLARFLLASGVPCLVAAPSGLQRPSGDRIKTDANDALHLTRLLQLGEITAVVIPTVEQESARESVDPAGLVGGNRDGGLLFAFGEDWEEEECRRLSGTANGPHHCLAGAVRFLPGLTRLLVTG